MSRKFRDVPVITVTGDVFYVPIPDSLKLAGDVKRALVNHDDELAKSIELVVLKRDNSVHPISDDADQVPMEDMNYLGIRPKKDASGSYAARALAIARNLSEAQKKGIEPQEFATGGRGTARRRRSHSRRRSPSASEPPRAPRHSRKVGKFRPAKYETPKATDRVRVFDILDNGGTPFRVRIFRDTLQVWELPETRFENDGSETALGPTKLVLTTKFQRLFLGASGSHAGVNILAHVSGSKYVYVGRNLISFQTLPGDSIEKFMVEVGNSAVPYGVAIGRKFVYCPGDEPHIAVALTEDVARRLAASKTPSEMWSVVDDMERARDPAVTKFKGKILREGPFWKGKYAKSRSVYLVDQFRSKRG